MSYHHLDAAELPVAENLLSGLVQASDTVHRLLAETKSIYATIQHEGFPPAASSDAAQRLSLIAQLDKLSNGDLEIASTFWSLPNVRTIQDVGKRYPAILELASDRTALFRTSIFALQSTATIGSLVADDVIDVQPASDKDMVMRIFGIAVAKNFEIGKNPISTLLNDPQCADVLKNDTTNNVKQFFQTLQRLQATVTFAEDIGHLLSAGLASAHAIASTPRSSFLQTMQKMGLTADSAVQIYDHSTTIEMRNEYAWATMLASRDDLVPAAITSVTAASASGSPSSAASMVINYANLFGDIDSSSSDESGAVTSPSAYFVDIMRLLKNSPSNPKVGGSPSLLKLLLDRRPDLNDIELSSANTNVLIPYIDLVNEVMESLVISLASAPGGSSPVQIPAFNMDEQDSSETCISQARNTNFAAYKKFLLPQVSPLSEFPYNQAIDTIRSYCTALGTSRYELMSIFQGKLASSKSDPASMQTLRAVQDCAAAAEFFGLLHQDIVAITGSSFFTRESLQLLENASITEEQYKSKISVRTVAEYWGFQAVPGMSADQVMLSKDKSTGLTCVKEQLLPRAAMSFPDLISMLKTRFFGQKLALTSLDGTKIFSKDLAELRLRNIVNSDAGGSLTMEDCNAIQAFVRLWKKVNWPIAELDTALACLQPLSATSSIISVNTIVELAAIQQLSKKTGIQVIRLLPLWGLIETRGENSLFTRLFIRGRQPDEARDFLPDQDGNYFSHNTSFNQNLNIVLSALQIAEDELRSTLTISAINDDAMNLSTLSQIYRIALFCKILGIKVANYTAFCECFGDRESPFSSPRATLAILEDYQKICQQGLGIQPLLFITGFADADTAHRNLQDAVVVEQILKTTAAIRQIRVQFDQSVLKQKAVQSGQDIVQICSLLFDPLVAVDAVAVVEGNNSIDKDRRLITYQKLLSQYFVGDQKQKQAQKIFFEQPAPSSSSQEDIIALENQIFQRRILFIENVLPELIRRLEDEAIVNGVGALFPELEPHILQRLLETENAVSGNSISGLQIWRNLVLDRTALNASQTLDTWFQAPSTDMYQFFVSGNEEPKMLLDNSLIHFTQTNGIWQSDELNVSGSRQYLISFNGSCSRISYSTRRKPAQELDLGSLVPIKSLIEALSLLRVIARKQLVMKTMSLSLDELWFLAPPVSTNQGIASISCEQLLLLSSAATLKNSLAASKLSMFEFLVWTKKADPDGDCALKLATLFDLDKEFVQEYLTVKHPAATNAELAKKYGDVYELERLYKIRNWQRQVGVAALPISLLFQLATPTLTPSGDEDFANAASFKASVPPVVGSSNDIATSAMDQIRLNQRSKLVSYLLTQDYLRKRNLYDADGLFEFLLIDVQMGVCLQTSRLKQAISTIQLFIRRCKLGLEASLGISSDSIDPTQWEWMQNYRVWEANRKVFLYPENWLDPTLRDNRSEIFTALQSSVLQSDANEQAIIEQIKAYVYAVDAIGDLQVEAYLWDRKPNYRGHFHFFARTRTIPYAYYYRRLDMTGRSDSLMDLHILWNAWSKIDVDIPASEADGTGKTLPASGTYLIPALFRNRLYLFIPSFLLKNDADSLDNTKSPRARSEEGVATNVPRKYWQIQMGWTEFRNGKWTPKQMSQSVLNVGGALASDWPLQGLRSKPEDFTGWTEAQKLPDISSFKFWVRSRPNTFSSNKPDILVMDVERWIQYKVNDKTKYVNYPLGRFELRGPYLALADLSTLSDSYKTPWKPTIPTTFAKLPWRLEQNTANAVPKLEIGRGGQSPKPLLGFVEPEDDEKTVSHDMKWTMSFNDSVLSRATGLVYETSTTEGLKTMFTFPPLANDVGGSNSQDDFYFTENFQHILSPLLMEKTTLYDGIDETFRTLSTVNEDISDLVFGSSKGLPLHELGTPYSAYNWELGVHVPMLLMERLMARQQFELAIKIAHLVFNPTLEGDALERCWLFPPFRDIVKDKPETIEQTLSKLQPSSGAFSTMDLTIAEWRKNPFTPFTIARGRPIAYMKRIVMKYIEALIAIGDDYFRQNTLESLPLAIQQYVLASHIFGPAPIDRPKSTTPDKKTPRSLEALLDDFSNAAVEMELDFPFLSLPVTRSGGSGVNFPKSLVGISRTTYFSIPPNPMLIDVRRQIDDRLYKIRHCLDINGVPRRLALFEPPLDPGMLVRRVALADSYSAAMLNDIVGPMPNYRFIYLLQKAFELCAELRSMEAMYLATREKRDSEALQLLKIKQDGIMQSITMDIRKTAKSEAEKSRDVLTETRKGQVSRLSYYLSLAGETAKQIPGAGDDWSDIPQVIEAPTTDDLRMSPNEKLEMDKAGDAKDLISKATTLDIISGVLRAIPAISLNAQPLGIGMSIGPMTINAADAIAVASLVLRSDAQACTDEGSRALRKAQLIQQLQDRRAQANTAGRDIIVTDKQIAALDMKVKSCDLEIEQQRKLAEQTTETEQWLLNKYTNEQLYAWMDGSVRNLFYQTYLLANDIAKKAQKAFNFENSTADQTFVDGSYWNASRNGLFSGENLYLSLKRMEIAYQQTKSYDFETVKNVSLRQVQPWALIALRETGVAEFSLPEVLFDFDFPGHYCRRLKTVSVTIPSIRGPFTGVNATLTLLEHRYRVQGSVDSNSDTYPEQKPLDPRFRTDQIPISAIAVSHGQQDSGVFELNIHDERYLPFEGAGAIGSWRMELPTAVRQFDYNSISDVVLHIRYTSRNGGATMRRAASEALVKFQATVASVAQTEGLIASFDVSSDFPNEWQRLIKPSSSGRLTLTNLQDRLPFFTKNKKITATSITLLVKSGAKQDLTGKILMKSDETDVNFTKGGPIGSYASLVSKDVSLELHEWLFTVDTQTKLEGLVVVIKYTVT